MYLLPGNYSDSVISYVYFSKIREINKKDSRNFVATPNNQRHAPARQFYINSTESTTKRTINWSIFKENFGTVDAWGAQLEFNP